VSFWNPEPTYPPDAMFTITFKATEGQKWYWSAAADRHGFGSRGAFISWAVDFAVLVLDAKTRQDEERRMEMNLWQHPGGANKAG
jgi:hypothetical protein